MGRPFRGSRGRAHSRNHFQVLLDVLPPVDDATAGERLFNSGITYNVCPSSDNEIRDEIEDRMCGSGTADVPFATETASSLVRKLIVYTPSELPSAAHSVPLDGIENFVGPVAAPRQKQYGGGKYRRRVSRLFDR